MMPMTFINIARAETTSARSAEVVSAPGAGRRAPQAPGGQPVEAKPRPEGPEVYGEAHTNPPLLYMYPSCGRVGMLIRRLNRGV